MISYKSYKPLLPCSSYVLFIFYLKLIFFLILYPLSNPTECLNFSPLAGDSGLLMLRSFYIIILIFNIINNENILGN